MHFSAGTFAVRQFSSLMLGGKQLDLEGLRKKLESHAKEVSTGKRAPQDCFVFATISYNDGQEKHVVAMLASWTDGGAVFHDVKTPSTTGRLSMNGSQMMVTINPDGQ